jgi:hypothetical protein
MADGWSVKRLHRRILLSAVYQQRSDDRTECRRVDAENLLLWRMNRRRLDFEATRDALLTAAGTLDQAVGGPPVKDLFAAASTRRTVYGLIDRLNLPGIFRTFDFPSPDATSPKRDSTTVAPQALFLMNHPFILEAARKVVRRPEVAAEKEFSRRVDRLYRLLYGRAPSAGEWTLAREYVGEGLEVSRAWEQYAQALMLANEFVFVD